MATIEGHDCVHLLCDLPKKEVEELIAHLTGQHTLDPCCVKDRAVGLLRYAVGICCRDHCPVPTTQAVGHLSPTQRADELKKLLVVGADPKGLNWSVIISLVMQIIQELMA